MSSDPLPAVANSYSTPSSPSSFSSPLALDRKLPSDLPSLIMKDVSSSSTRNVRTQLYPKKRPSPHRDGVQKSRCKETPSSISRRTPAAIKAEIQRLRLREAQLAAFRKEGIYVEEEYREDICYYMHEMEVSRTTRIMGQFTWVRI